VARGVLDVRVDGGGVVGARKGPHDLSARQRGHEEVEEGARDGLLAALVYAVVETALAALAEELLGRGEEAR